MAVSRLATFRGQKKVNMDYTKLKKVYKLLSTLANEDMVHIVNWISSQRRACNVTEVWKSFRDVQYSVIDTKITELREIGVLTSEKRGKYVYYSVNKDKINLINKKIWPFI